MEKITEKESESESELPKQDIISKFFANFDFVYDKDHSCNFIGSLLAIFFVVNLIGLVISIRSSILITILVCLILGLISSCVAFFVCFAEDKNKGSKNGRWDW